MAVVRDKFVEEEQLWYKDAIIYELHVKSFFDSNDDGIGDFQGLIRKLDYLKGLGITAIWILPFYPSPLKDDGYDIAYYFNVHPNYGTLADFREFLRAAHKRGLKVITELVLNHTSDQHPWFQRARRSKPGSVWRNFYVWSDSPEKYGDARIIFKDFESSNWTWDPVAKAYYWHRFYSHQPDLNYDNPFLQRSMLKVVDNWLKTGVDGLRLDAVPYLYEREGTNCENLPETHDFLKKLRRHIDERFKNRMVLGEANQWPEDAVAYFGQGDECHMAFHFPLMPRIFMSLQMEDRFPLIDILEQTPRIPEQCQWGLFLRNHDELTLEMVTDEERDYMHRVYARDPRTRINLGIRRRLGPLLDNDRRKIELMNIILFSLPGTPIIYYGDEIGMGDNYYLGDRDGVRTPMQWSSDRNAGFSKANPQKLYLPVIIDPEYHYEALNVENDERNPSSLLWWMKRVIAMRKRMKAFSRGDLHFPPSDNAKVLAFTRTYEEETILVVVNLSRFSQVAEIDLSDYAGMVPVEVFSRNRFPVIRETPYVLTMGFYDYYWFHLRREESEEAAAQEGQPLPELAVKKDWTAVLEGKSVGCLLEDVLPAYLRRSRWFGGKARSVRKISIYEDVPVESASLKAHLLILRVSYTEGPPEGYLMPLAFGTGDRMKEVMEGNSRAVLARLLVEGEEGILYDGIQDEALRSLLLEMISSRKKIRGLQGRFLAYPGREFKKIQGERKLPLGSAVVKTEQSNTSVLYDNIFYLKLYRRVSAGPNPDAEICRFLTERAGFPHVPPFAGMIEYRRPGLETVVIGQLQGFVSNQGDAWTYTVDRVRQYFEMVLSKNADAGTIPATDAPLFDISFQVVPPLLQELIGAIYLGMAALLGRRTGEMHLALASATGYPDFEPEPFSLLYQRSMYQSMRSLTRRVMQLLGRSIGRLPEEVSAGASEVLAAEQKILSVYQKVLTKKISAMKIRYHGDYHLGQVLHTGKDFVIIDFEGEPARPLSERRLKRSPVRDVAGMIRSFHYAVHSALLQYPQLGVEEQVRLREWADVWYHYVSGIFLGSYMATVEKAAFVPKDRSEFEVLLQCFLLEKAVYELGYELNNRPDWVMIPVKGIQHILRNF